MAMTMSIDELYQKWCVPSPYPSSSTRPLPFEPVTSAPISTTFSRIPHTLSPSISSTVAAVVSESRIATASKALQERIDELEHRTVSSGRLFRRVSPAGSQPHAHEHSTSPQSVEGDTHSRAHHYSFVSDAAARQHVSPSPVSGSSSFAGDFFVAASSVPSKPLRGASVLEVPLPAGSRVDSCTSPTNQLAVCHGIADQLMSLREENKVLRRQLALSEESSAEAMGALHQRHMHDASAWESERDSLEQQLQQLKKTLVEWQRLAEMHRTRGDTLTETLALSEAARDVRSRELRHAQSELEGLRRQLSTLQTTSPAGSDGNKQRQATQSTQTLNVEVPSTFFVDASTETSPALTSSEGPAMPPPPRGEHAAACSDERIALARRELWHAAEQWSSVAEEVAAYAEAVLRNVRDERVT